MADYKRVLTIDNEVEAQLLIAILDERGLPYLVTSYRDSALDGLFQSQKGWGHLDAPEEHEEEILEIYRGLTEGRQNPTDDE